MHTFCKDIYYYNYKRGSKNDIYVPSSKLKPWNILQF